MGFALHRWPLVPISRLAITFTVVVCPLACVVKLTLLLPFALSTLRISRAVSCWRRLLHPLIWAQWNSGFTLNTSLQFAYGDGGSMFGVQAWGRRTVDRALSHSSSTASGSLRGEMLVGRTDKMMYR